MATPTAAASSIFANLGSAKARISANYVRQGHYLCRYDRVKVDRSRQQKDFMVFEMTVVKVIDNDSERGHRLGENVSHMLTATGNDCFLGNVKTIISNVLGIKPEEVQAADAEQVCAADQPLAGMVVEIKARTITTRANKSFTEVNHLREVPPSELKTSLDAPTIAAYFPNGLLDKLIAQGA